MLGISAFDLFFFIAVAVCEIHWYRKSKSDDMAFQEFQTEVTDRLEEISQRLDEAIGPVVDDDSVMEEPYVEAVQKS